MRLLLSHVNCYLYRRRLSNVCYYFYPTRLLLLSHVCYYLYPTRLLLLSNVCYYFYPILLLLLSHTTVASITADLNFCDLSCQQHTVFLSADKRLVETFACISAPFPFRWDPKPLCFVFIITTDLAILRQHSLNRLFPFPPPPFFPNQFAMVWTMAWCSLYKPCTLTRPMANIGLLSPQQAWLGIALADNGLSVGNGQYIGFSFAIKPSPS